MHDQGGLTASVTYRAVLAESIIRCGFKSEFAAAWDDRPVFKSRDATLRRKKLM
jgi:hypothetical protein